MRYNYINKNELLEVELCKIYTTYPDGKLKSFKPYDYKIYSNRDMWFGFIGNKLACRCRDKHYKLNGSEYIFYFTELKSYSRWTPRIVYVLTKGHIFGSEHIIELFFKYKDEINKGIRKLYNNKLYLKEYRKELEHIREVDKQKMIQRLSV